MGGGGGLAPTQNKRNKLPGKGNGERPGKISPGQSPNIHCKRTQITHAEKPRNVLEENNCFNAKEYENSTEKAISFDRG